MLTAFRVSRAVGSRTSMSTVSTPASARLLEIGRQLDRIMNGNNRLRQLARRGVEGKAGLGERTGRHRQGQRDDRRQRRGKVTHRGRRRIAPGVKARPCGGVGVIGFGLLTGFQRRPGYASRAPIASKNRGPAGLACIRQRPVFRAVPGDRLSASFREAKRSSRFPGHFGHNNNKVPPRGNTL